MMSLNISNCYLISLVQDDKTSVNKDLSNTDQRVVRTGELQELYH